MNKKHFVKASLAFLAAAAFCVIYTAIYYRFSHMVFSDAMTYMFLYPLLLGAVPYALFATFSEKVTRSRAAFNMHNSGIATLTVGSCSAGVFEISGGESPLLPIFFIVGALFCTAGILKYVVTVIRKHNKI